MLNKSFTKPIKELSVTRIISNPKKTINTLSVVIIKFSQTSKVNRIKIRRGTVFSAGLITIRVKPLLSKTGLVKSLLRAYTLKIE